MKAGDRKAALAAYRERKAQAGIYALRCSASGEIWVGAAPDLSAIRNRHWFTLRIGTNLLPALQQAWDAHGEEAIQFEVVERLDSDLSAMARELLLKQRLAHWLAELGAVRI